ncbi:MAG: D-alanyl-D-alanine carboxypeptidase [Candidatus Sumerlaeia bacterium]|nr:D-alanyl-D-alanine carboxypeptidase [Candidatus Sumerlaeia bacterium]
MTFQRTFFGVLICCLATMGSAASLADQIDEIIASSVAADYDWSIVVENENGSVRYYERNPHMVLAPASVTKLYTTSAAYELVGADHQFKSEVFHTGSISRGTLDGDINLLVHFDVTWNSHTLDNVREPLDRIATALREQGVEDITGDVNVYGVSLYNRGQFDNVRNTASTTLNAQTAEAFQEALVEAGISVGGDTSGQAGFDPPGTLIYTHLSGSITTRWGIPGDLTGATHTINRISHNPSAETLLRMVAYEATGSSILLADGGMAVIDLLSGLGINTNGMAMLDGSGLSHANRFSSEQTIALLRHMNTKYPDTWYPTLAIGCESGTISSRYCGEETAGRVRGKTGTLSVSIALSGLVENSHGDDRYYFSFLANTSGIERNPTRDVIEECVRLLAKEEMNPAPVLGSVINPGTGNTLEVSWPNPGGQELFLLQKSNDGVTFDDGVIVPARYIIESRHDLQSAKNGGDVEFFGDFDPSSENSSATGTTPGAGSLFARPAPTRGDRARFTPSIASGEYEVFVTSFNFASANAPGITVRMEDADGPRDFAFDMVQEKTGGQWASLGTMNITHGEGHFVEFDNETQTEPDANARMNPAAVMFVPTSSTFEKIVYTDTGLSGGQARHYRVAGVGRDGAVSSFSPVLRGRSESGR